MYNKHILQSIPLNRVFQRGGFNLWNKVFQEWFKIFPINLKRSTILLVLNSYFTTSINGFYNEMSCPSRSKLFRKQMEFRIMKKHSLSINFGIFILILPIFFPLFQLQFPLWSSLIWFRIKSLYWSRQFIHSTLMLSQNMETLASLQRVEFRRCDLSFPWVLYQ